MSDARRTALARQVDAPLMLDSTQIKTLEAGLKRAPGKCIINSANFEDGEEKFDEICRSRRRLQRCALVIGTIDEDEQAAMARTADRKFEIASGRSSARRPCTASRVHDIFIDPLVLPISTGMDSDRRSALELIEGVRRIAEAYPDVQITCGLSNVVRLKPAARVVLNSVLPATSSSEAGLTSAIVHASKILPLTRKIEDEQQRGRAMT